MAISIPAAPPQSIDALRAGLPSVADLGTLARVAPRLAAALTKETAAAVKPALSYPVYALGLTDLATIAKSLREAKPSFWRHTLTFDGEFATADTVADASGQKLAALNINPPAAGMQDSINRLSQESAIASASYEAGLLQIPALGVRAVWLHDPNDKSPDILVPVAPVRSDLVAGRQYTVNEFQAALNDAAQRILANDDPRKGA
ncbi:MAG TPA: hypothetical protein VGI19_03420 [Candidatus Cybelea sp.]|jgi:hypothetical protein